MCNMIKIMIKSGKCCKKSKILRELKTATDVRKKTTKIGFLYIIIQWCCWKLWFQDKIPLKYI